MSIPRPNGRGSFDRIVVPCGKCPVCDSNRREEWSIRLLEEYKVSKGAIFVTLTYNEENVPYGLNDVQTLVKTDFQNFIKRIRKKSNGKIRYYAIGEYGTKTYRPHYHAIIFNSDCINSLLIENAWSKHRGNTSTNKPIFEPIGNVHIGTVNIRSIMYICKYHLNKGIYPVGADPPFALMSRNPGIGANYIMTHEDYHQRNVEMNAYYSDYERKKRLPRYYKNKIYTKEQRAVLSEKFKDERFSTDKVLEFLKTHPNAKVSEYFKMIHQQEQKRQSNITHKSKLNQKL